ncbi:MAG: tetratricopeptide repeat protein [Hungatella sp.]|nr:tetratricopeptide repeat protein [Hungatella sp.]
MERQMVFHILGIEETKDEQVIRDAYRGLLKSANPEDDPDGFKRLREAYEEALNLARQPEEEEEKEKTEIDLWVERVDKIYQDIRARCDARSWEEVVSDPLCEGLDTSLQTREALLVYLMDHIYLPYKIWNLLDEHFQIVDEQENLLQKFPKDFVDYIVYYIQHESFIDYELFQVTDKNQADADAYIRGYLDIKRQIDQGNPKEQEQRLNDLRAFGIYHPYEDAERLRIWSSYGLCWRDDEGEEETVREQTPEVGKAQELADRLLKDYEEDSYILLYCGEARWAGGRREDAYEIWKEILKDNPSHYMAKYGTARYLICRKEYEEAKELMMDLLNVDGRDPAVLEDMRKTNEALISKYKESIAGPEGDQEQKNKDTVELGWCLFQNEYMDEAIELLKDFTPVPEEEYSYENLYGRLLYKAEHYEEALPHLKRWLKLIEETPDDGSDENTKRLSREFRACHIISGCCHELGQPEAAMEYVDKAIEKAELFQDKQACMQYKAYLMFEDEKYKESIDICDRILEEDEGYFPAVLQRQEAAYEMKNGQQVVDDYYRAIRIYAGYYKPYLLAAEAFFYSNQFSDAMGVLNRARENEVEFSPNMKLYEIKILRNLAEKKEDRDKPFAIAEELLSLIKDKPADVEMDIEDLSEVEYEIALLHWDNDNLYKALEHLETAIGQNPERMQYRMIRGHVYLDKKEYKKALTEYSAASEVYGGAPALHYNKGLCQEALGMKVLAMEEYEKALQCQEAYRDANEKLADYYKDKYTSTYDQADFERAMGYLDRQLNYRENCYYLVERGRLYMSAYRLEEAIKEFEKALTYDPEDWASYNNMGCCYKYMGQFEKAIECLNKAVECMKDNKSVLPYSNMADCYEAMGDYRKAIWCYEKDLEMFPDRKTFRKEIGLLYQYLEEYDNALKYFEMEPELDDYYDNVASIYYLQGRTREAVKTYVKGINKASKEDKTKRMSDLAYFYKEILCDFKKAEGYYKKAIAAAVTEDDLHETEWKLASLCFRAGKRNDAKIHAEKALEHFRKTDNGTEENYLNYLSYRPARLMRFGWIYICLGQTEKGLEMFRQMTECRKCRQCRYKECFEAYQYLGMYYEAIGDRRNAYENYKRAYELNDHSISITIAWKRIQK